MSSIYFSIIPYHLSLSKVENVGVRGQRKFVKGVGVKTGWELLL